MRWARKQQGRTEHRSHPPCEPPCAEQAPQAHVARCMQIRSGGMENAHEAAPYSDLQAGGIHVGPDGQLVGFPYFYDSMFELVDSIVGLQGQGVLGLGLVTVSSASPCPYMLTIPSLALTIYWPPFPCRPTILSHAVALVHQTPTYPRSHGLCS